MTNYMKSLYPNSTITLSYPFLITQPEKKIYFIEVTKSADWKYDYESIKNNIKNFQFINNLRMKFDLLLQFSLRLLHINICILGKFMINFQSILLPMKCSTSLTFTKHFRFTNIYNFLIKFGTTLRTTRAN